MKRCVFSYYRLVLTSVNRTFCCSLSLNVGFVRIVWCRFSADMERHRWEIPEVRVEFVSNLEPEENQEPEYRGEVTNVEPDVEIELASFDSAFGEVPNLGPNDAR